MSRWCGPPALAALLLIPIVLGSGAAARAEAPGAPDSSAQGDAGPQPEADGADAGEATAGAEATRMREVVVRGRADDLVGVADSASEGVVGSPQLESRPVLRPGEVMETVPGVIVTQHSGGGKANQYFLRGFNLDHGTDLATSLDGIPLNLPSHGHGQGYTDLNFLIPELVQAVDYEKGPYFADEGDFSSAGAAEIHTFDVLPRGIAKLEGGQFDYGRALVADSPSLWGGHLLYALEGAFDGGPWDHPDDYTKANGLLRFSRGDARGGFSVTGAGYLGDWSATDQVPERAVREGLIDRFGAIDPSDAGRSSRASLSGEWHGGVAGGQARVLLYGYYYDLQLFSNFTYFLDHPMLGDQFEQTDRRFVLGLVPTYRFAADVLGLTLDNTIGLQVRSDLIENGLYATQGRHRLSTTRQDRVTETSAGLFLENRVAWTDWLRSVAGARVDLFDFDVDSNRTANSGHTSDAIVSPKLALIFGPWYQTEVYLNGGLGFHSNDARGVLGRVDPKSGAPVQPADALVRSKGAEVGIRTAALPGLRSSVAFWILDLDSELLFVGDAGTNEPSRPSRRYGIELANYYSPTDWLTFDADVSISRAHFRDRALGISTPRAPVGGHVPGSIESVVAAGVTVHDLWGFFGSARLRYFGPRALVEDDRVRSGASTLVDLQAGYRFTESWSVTLDVFNLFDAKVSDIDYFYVSRLPGERVDGVPDVHLHPAEPRAFRASVTYRFGGG
jgi:outer membrane receptor protein involved in Fe transport